jgi:hypothetical protein
MRTTRPPKAEAHGLTSDRHCHPEASFLPGQCFEPVPVSAILVETPAKLYEF